MSSGFFAYPNHDRLNSIIQRAANRISNAANRLKVTTWPQLDIIGHFISTKVTQQLEQADAVFGDITFPNFNVYYEIGFALGKHKYTVPTLCSSLESDARLINKLGLFDTLGQLKYQNSDELASELITAGVKPPLNFSAREIDTGRPVFLLEPRIKGEGITMAKRRLELERIQYRAFDPVEQPRLSLTLAYTNVQQSIAVVTHLLCKDEAEHLENNLRAAFVIGLSHGMGKRVLILQHDSSPVPLDYRDFVNSYTSDEQFNRYFSQLTPYILESLQSGPRLHSPGKNTVLERIELGSPAAENEAEKLRIYYLETDQTRQVLAGNVRLVVGRKGTGKSALFFHVRDKLSQDARNLVMSIRPDGAQVKRLREMIIKTLDDPAKEHVATALWEYVLLLEILRSYINQDQETYKYNHHIHGSYVDLLTTLENHEGEDAVDFTDLLATLITRLNQALPKVGVSGLLTSRQITRALYAADIANLRKTVCEYAIARQLTPWILIDNLDKGWPTRGISSEDVIILRGLIDATRKLEQYMERQEVTVSAVVFIRNDVYENLVEETPDRGKESQVSLDWSDPDLLKELLRRRLLYSKHFSPEETFNQIWHQIGVANIGGYSSADYLIERSMMRPRNLISIVSYCRSNSVNLKHNMITADDITKAIASYSSDATREIGLEIRDIFPEAEDVLYAFLGACSNLSFLTVTYKLREEISDHISVDTVVQLLMWFGFLGVVVNSSNNSQSDIYIHNSNYDLKKLLKLANNLQDPNTALCINPAFWPFLEIEAIAG